MAGSLLASASDALGTASYATWKLTKSTGKAAWITATTLLVLAVPLIIEMDRESQMVEFESQQMGALTGPGSAQQAPAK